MITLGWKTYDNSKKKFHVEGGDAIPIYLPFLFSEA